MALPLVFDHFYRYDEIVAFLQQAKNDHPRLADLESVGKSYESRDIWCLTLTNKDTGAHNEKPAMYIDANIHAGEVTGSHVALYTIKQLLEGYGECPTVTNLLDTRTFYILPRVNPDGAELYLTSPTMLRSSVRPYPDEEEKDGLRPEDIDGNGVILQMRVLDPTGPWKVSERDPRIMVLRGPDEMGGRYYRVYPEGRIYGPTDEPIPVAAVKYGLDINRNFPANWVISQQGAGPYPLSEPETRALAEFIIGHPNIAAFQAYHTTGGVIYRAFCNKPDEQMNREDLALFKAIGRRGEEILGYPCIPASHGGLGAVRAGIFIDWVYEHCGIIGYSTELWDLMGRAGADKKKETVDKIPEDHEDDQYKMLKWQDEHLGGKGFVDWTWFDHPQLGKVEIGGWQPKTVRQNAPAGKFLEEECDKNYRFTNAHALTTPLLSLSDVQKEDLGSGIWRLSCLVSNDGYMATYGTRAALENGVVKPTKVTLEADRPFDVLEGTATREIGHLDGRAQAAVGWYGPGGATKSKRKLSWLLKAAEGTDITICAVALRGGTKRQTVTLG